MARELRILLVRLSHLGDVVHALPLFHAVRAAHPDARIAWAIEPEFEPLVRGLPGLERTIPFERRAGARAWPRLARGLREFGADWAIDAQANSKSALVTLLSRAPRRSGLARADWRERLGAVVLNDPAPPLARGTHAVERALHLARHVAPGADAPRYDLGLGAEELAAGAALADELLPAPDGVIAHLSDPRDVRAWPLARWSELVHELARNTPVLVVSGPGEETAGRELQRALALPNVAHLVGQSGPRTLAALFTAAAARGTRFVGCDSGPAHLAWSAGLPVTLLAGPQDAARTGPWPLGAPHQIVASRTPPACAPCLARRCSHPDGPVCMSAIEPRDVLLALRDAEAVPR